MSLLLLIGLGAASVKAQVRIGGNTPPNPAAALDLNANDDATPAGNKGALALPRVSLASTTAQLNGVTPITGMLVYNTNTALGVGIYFWDGTMWVRLAPTWTSLRNPVTWYMTLDTQVYCPPLTGHQAINIAMAGLLVFDVCVPSTGNSGLIFHANNDLLGVLNADVGPAGGGYIPIRCFRAVPAK